MKVQQLRAERSDLAKQVQNILGNREWNTEAKTETDKLYARIEQIDDQLAAIKRAADLEVDRADHVPAELPRIADRAPAGTPTEEVARKIFTKWLRGGDQAVTAAEWQTIRATMSTTTNSEGGYTVPTQVATQLYDALKIYGGVRSVANVIRTDNGQTINYPNSDGTSETGELIAENTTATAADPTFGVTALATYKYSSKIVAVPFELLADSNVDIEAFVRGRLAQRLGRISNTHFTTGTGSSQPKGVVTAAGSGKTGTTGQTISVIFDDLVDLVHSVDPAYRVQTCSWMMNDASLKVIRKLKDSQNRPIYLPGDGGLADAMGDTLLGHRIVVNQDVATMAANAKSILFGAFGNYIVRDVMDVQMFRFADSPYIKLGQIGFLAWARMGGTYPDVGASLKYYANSVS